MADKEHASPSVRWARFRFQVVGPLLAAPPDSGELGRLLDELAAKRYQHPTRSDERIAIGRSTIERWYYTAKSATTDPVVALARKVNAHAGTHPKLGAALADAIATQYRQHSSWSYQLHHDNLVALAKEKPEICPAHC